MGEKKVPDAILVGCWRHPRRKFHDASVAVKPADRRAGKRIAADEGLKLCNDLFQLEKEFREMSADQRRAARQERSAAKLDQIKPWLNKAAVDVLPGTATGRASAYCLNQWTKLTAFLLAVRLQTGTNNAHPPTKPSC